MSFPRRETAAFLGLLTVILLNTLGPDLLADLSSPWKLTLLFLWLFPLILWCAVSVVRHADCLAHLLGEPYGTLILTLAAVIMEVALITSAMLTGAADPLLARDTMFAVLMIVLNGLIGLSLVIGAIRNGEQEFNISGASAYLSVIATLSVLTLVLPAFTISTADHTYTPHQMLFFSTAALLLYGVFLMVQTHRHRGFFQEPAHRGSSGHAPQTRTAQARTVPHHALMLVLSLLPVVLLAEMLSAVIESGARQLRLPSAFGGVLIAMLVLTAEGISAIAAARADRLQRAVNISLGSALSTIGLTVPAVMLIAVTTGQQVILGLAQEFIALLVLTLFVSLLTFGTGRTNVLLGAVHLILFAAYVGLLFEP
ncbi:calcium:proton antiporter [Roseococcus sp. SYP-B2431]|uniref:calcium:proton antiporter n=1 Tax=Roseococcus sp. SYP-B2431 TaxID=2496640 RepID=UPI00103B67B7|nr:calcium:proton antiporter [Roseococcus sp. SYP-B2431]TCH96005.1 calcium:proton antiporter [Roseococcus sp. SYP-B2431]